MTVEEFEQTKERIEKLKEESLKAKGMQESILAKWKEQGINSVEDAESKIKEIEKQIENKTVRKEKIEEQLKQLLGE